MPCPNCRSNDLWDDNLAWGCNKCPFFTTGAVRNNTSTNDTWGRYESPYKITETEKYRDV